MKTKLIIGLVALLAVSCQSPGVVQISPNTYVLFRKDHAGIFGSESALKDGVIRDANAFAEEHGKIAIPISEKEHPVGILGDWASFEYRFRLVDTKASFVVVSDPPGAKIEIDGRFIGLAPKVIEGTAEANTESTIRATPASLDTPVLGVLSGFTNVNGRLSLDPSYASVVSLVFPNTPASQMGLLAGDRIVGVNGVDLPETTGSMESGQTWAATLRNEFSHVGFGGQVTLKVIRNGIATELKGQTSEQTEGEFYVQEKMVNPRAFDGQVILFDMRRPSPMPIIVNARGNETMPHKGATSTGTGFVVAEGGYVLTCQHVIGKSDNIIVRDTTGAKHKARAVASDKENDLCLLLVDNLETKPIPAAPPNSVRIGESVYCLGFPMEGVLENQDPVAGNGVVASLRGLNGDPRHLQITVPVNPGNSGGPVLDVHGRWVAVASHKLSDFYGMATTGQTPQGINFAVKGSLVVSLFDSIPEVKMPISESEENLSLEQITKRLSGAVVSISATE